MSREIIVVCDRCNAANCFNNDVCINCEKNLDYIKSVARQLTWPNEWIEEGRKYGVLAMPEEDKRHLFDSVEELKREYMKFGLTFFGKFNPWQPLRDLQRYPSLTPWNHLRKLI